MSRRRAWRFRIRLLVGVRDVPLLQNVQTSSGATQSPIQWAPGFFPRVKWPERDVDSWPPYRALVRNEWSYTSTPPMCLHGVDSTLSRQVTSGLTFLFLCLPCGLNTDEFNFLFIRYFRSLLLAFLSCLLVLFVGINKATRLSYRTLVLLSVLISCLRSCICEYD